MDKTLEELKAEADVLGVEYSKNIGAAKLAEKLEAFYESQSAGDLVKEATPEELAAKEAKVVDKTVLPVVDSQADFIKMRKAEAMKKSVVVITSNDKRDNEYVTAEYLSCENQFFGVSKLVPLNIPVELEECLIEVAKTTMVMLHQDEITPDGRRTGNKVTRMTRKFNVSYEQVK